MNPEDITKQEIIEHALFMRLYLKFHGFLSSKEIGYLKERIDRYCKKEGFKIIKTPLNTYVEKINESH